MKHIGAMVIVLLVLGLTASSAMAASDIVPKSIPSKSIPSASVSKCPCCSGNVSLPKDVKVQELRGPVAYFKALEAFNVRDALKLRNNLNHFDFVPDFHNAVVQLVSSPNGATEIIKIPLHGRYPGLLIHVRNRLGAATGIALYKNNSVEVYYYTGSSLHKSVRILPTSIGGAVKCVICVKVAEKICAIGYNRAVKWGCGRLCGIACAALVEDPIAALICAGTCYFICQKVLTKIKEVSCAAGATAICVAIGACRG